MTSRTGKIRGLLWEILQAKGVSIGKKPKKIRYGITSPISHLDLVPFSFLKPLVEASRTTFLSCTVWLPRSVVVGFCVANSET